MFDIHFVDKTVMPCVPSSVAFKAIALPLCAAIIDRDTGETVYKKFDPYTIHVIYKDCDALTVEYETLEGARNAYEASLLCDAVKTVQLYHGSTLLSMENF